MHRDQYYQFDRNSSVRIGFRDFESEFFIEINGQPGQLPQMPQLPQPEQLLAAAISNPAILAAAAKLLTGL